MRILIVCPHVPYPLDNGGSIRAYRIARGLAARHDVDVLALSAGESGESAREALGEFCSSLQIVAHRPPRLRNAALGMVGRPYSLRNYWSARIAKAICDGAKDADVVLFNSLHMAQYGRGDRPWVVDTHNVEHVQWERNAETGGHALARAYCRRQARAMRRWEGEVLSRAGAVFVCSRADGEFLGLDVIVAPNGASLPETARRDPARAEFLFVGDLSWRPNIDAVRRLCGEILPALRGRVPDARVTVVGKNPSASVSALGGDDVEIVGPVESVVPYLERATALVVPLRSGSGTRLKILEAMAARVPVISTAIGCEGLEVVDGEHLLVADTTADFAGACARLATDGELAGRIATAARELVERDYGWDRSVEIIDEACRGVAARGRS